MLLYLWSIFFASIPHRILVPWFSSYFIHALFRVHLTFFHVSTISLHLCLIEKQPWTIQRCSRCYSTVLFSLILIYTSCFYWLKPGIHSWASSLVMQNRITVMLQNLEKGWLWFESRRWFCPAFSVIPHLPLFSSFFSLCSLISIILSQLNQLKFDVKALRAFRVLRPLRLVSRAPSKSQVPPPIGMHQAIHPSTPLEFAPRPHFFFQAWLPVVSINISDLNPQRMKH